MRKKGFTLIESLAVIVILAIIALIATPIVMNVIEGAKEGAAERSAENYLRAVETAIAEERLDGPIEDGVYELDANGDLVHTENNSIKIEVEVSGNAPTSVTILIQNGQIVTKLSGAIGEGKDNIVTTITIKGETFNRNEEGKLEVVEKVEEGENTSTQPQYYTWDYQGTVGGAAPENPSSVAPTEKIVYIGYNVSDGIISEAYVCFVRNGNQYCLKGADDSSFAANIEKANLAFADAGKSCNVTDTVCGLSEKNDTESLNVTFGKLYGAGVEVYAYIAGSRCDIGSSKSFSCAVW